MKTEDLIGMLAADAAPPPPLRMARIAGVVLMLMAVAVGLFLWQFGIRDALGQALQRPTVAAKTLLPLILCGIAWPMTLAQMRPDAAGAVRLRWLVLPLLAGIALWIAAFLALAPAVRFADVSRYSVSECLWFISVLSLLPLAILLVLMRRGASPAPARAGALAGLSVASGVAAGYSLFCVMDSPLFFVTWYGIAILIVAAIGALLGSRLLRW